MHIPYLWKRWYRTYLAFANCGIMERIKVYLSFTHTSMSYARAAFPSKFAALGLAVLAAVALLGYLAFNSSAASETVLLRGVVKPGGATDSVNVYITTVTTAADATAIRGTRTDVNVAKATKYKWQVVKGVLTKVRTTSNPTPGQEVVLKGTRLSDGRINASWMVVNYRDFVIEGKLQARTLDTGKTDSGYVTVEVTSSIFRNVVPAKEFKQAALKGKDLRIRVDGTTAITSLGKSKNFDEVTAGQQKVRIEGGLMDEDTWTASKLNELNS